MQEKCFHQKNAFFHMLSCDNMCFHMLSCLIMSYHVLSCLITSYHVLSRLIMSYHVLSCLIMPFTCCHVITCVFLSFLAAQPPAFDFFGLPFFWLSSHHMLIFLLAVQPSHVDFFCWLSSHHMLIFFGCPAITCCFSFVAVQPPPHSNPLEGSTPRKIKRNNQIQGCSSSRLTWGPCPLKNPTPFRDAAPIG